jgi:phosphate transport system substrate-binding protein
MKLLKFAWISVGILLLILGPQTGMCQEKQVIRISGALPLSDLVNGWAAEYMKKKPNIQISVFGKTAGHGYSQLIDGQADLGMVTRPMTDEERKLAEAKGIKIAEKSVMNIDIVVVTNVKNPVSELSLDQLRDIYSGAVSNWKNVGGPDEIIKVTQRPYPDTGVAVLFKELVMPNLDYRKDAMVMSSFKNMVHICEQSLAIGHIPSTAVFCDPTKYQIKLLALKKDANSPAVQPGHADYPLKMPFLFAWNTNPGSKEIDDFVQFAVEKAKQGKQ